MTVSIAGMIAGLALCLCGALGLLLDRLQTRIDALEALVEQMGPPYLSDTYPETVCFECTDPAVDGSIYCNRHSVTDTVGTPT